MKLRKIAQKSFKKKFLLKKKYLEINFNETLETINVPLFNWEHLYEGMGTQPVLH